MTEAITERSTPKRRNGAAKRDRVRMVADDIVTASSLAVHLGMTRQAIAWLTQEAIIEQRSDGHYDQSASRLKYLKHLRSERRSPRTAADTAHVAAKTEMLRMKLQEKQHRLVPFEVYEEMIDSLTGLVLTHLGGLPARCAGNDLPLRRRLDGVVREVRVAMAEAANKMAAENGPSPDQRQAQVTAAGDH